MNVGIDKTRHQPLATAIHRLARTQPGLDSDNDPVDDRDIACLPFACKDVEVLHPFDLEVAVHLPLCGRDTASEHFRSHGGTLCGIGTQS